MSLGKTLIEEAKKSRMLQACPICSSLEDSALGSIARIAVERKYAKGEFLIQEGENATGFYLVLSGKVRVFKSAPSGKEKVLLIAETGMTFGEDALFGQGVFMESARALSEVKALLIPRAEFLNMLRKNTELGFQVMESLCIWIRRLSGSVENVAFLSARGKIARYLITGTQSAPDRSLLMRSKKKDVADELGVTPETFSRILHEFSKRRLIRIENKKVTVLQPEALKGETE